MSTGIPCTACGGKGSWRAEGRAEQCTACAGVGPESGWVSVRVRDEDLLRRTDWQSSAAHALDADHYLRSSNGSLENPYGDLFTQIYTTAREYEVVWAAKDVVGSDKIYHDLLYAYKEKHSRNQEIFVRQPDDAHGILDKILLHEHAQVIQGNTAKSSGYLSHAAESSHGRPLAEAVLPPPPSGATGLESSHRRPFLEAHVKTAESSRVVEPLEFKTPLSYDLHKSNATTSTSEKGSTWDESKRSTITSAGSLHTCIFITARSTCTEPTRDQCNTAWGYRGQRVGEASHPGPLGFVGAGDLVTGEHWQEYTAPRAGAVDDVSMQTGGANASDAQNQTAPPPQRHGAPSQIAGMRLSTSEVQGHGVDEPEALTEALRRSIGLPSRDPVAASTAAPVAAPTASSQLPVSPSPEQDVSGSHQGTGLAGNNAAWQRAVRPRQEATPADAAEAALADDAMGGGEAEEEGSRRRLRRQSAAARASGRVCRGASP